jgi:hypothetical protein
MPQKPTDLQDNDEYWEKFWISTKELIVKRRPHKTFNLLGKVRLRQYWFSELVKKMQVTINKSTQSYNPQYYSLILQFLNTQLL